MQDNRKVHFLTTTEGCATNLLESATYRRNATQGGLSEVSVEDADIIVVNTCAYTKGQEDRSIDIVSKLQSEHPNKEVIVGGCLTKINPQRLKEVHSGFQFEPADVKSFNQYLDIENTASEDLVNFFDEKDFVDLTWMHKAALKVRPILKWIEDKTLLNFKFLNNIFETSIVNTDYFAVTVSKGCAGKCTFCAIKNAKGYVQSKSIAQVMHEIQRGLDQGHRKIWLLGDDIGCYGIDNNETFVDLLRRILDIPVDFKLVINYFEPYFFNKYFDDMKVLLADKRIVNFNLPIQSGNRMMVRKMGREYDPSIVLNNLQLLKKDAPSLVVKTNIITGFPGETWSQFYDSVKSVFAFDAILALDYTSRPGTGADKYKNHLTNRTKFLRIKLINYVVLLRHFYVFCKSLVFRGN